LEIDPSELEDLFLMQETKVKVAPVEAAVKTLLDTRRANNVGMYHPLVTLCIADLYCSNHFIKDSIVECRDP